MNFSSSSCTEWWLVVTTRLIGRASLVGLRVGGTLLWSGLPWISETAIGGRWLATTLGSMGVIGIKLGQYLSQRPDIFNTASRRELARLTDQNESVPWSDLQPRCVIEGMSSAETPAIGTGSLAQVHRVQWQQEYAVAKVLLPGDTTVLMELRICRYGLELLCRLGLLPIRWDLFLDETERQLDLRHEADELAYAYELFGGAEGLLLSNATRIRVPCLHHASRHCLIMEQARGRSLHDWSISSRDGQRAFHARTQVLEYMTTSGDRRFHADLHDGNVWYDESEDTLWLIDFGLCAHPPPDWEPPLGPMLAYTGHPDQSDNLVALLGCLFSIDATEALSLVPLFQEVMAPVATCGTIQGATKAFLTFTRRVGHRIGPHTMAYFMQLIVTGYGLHSDPQE